MREPNLGRLLWVSIASVGPSWHVGFTPDFGRIAARQRTDASGQCTKSLRDSEASGLSESTVRQRFE
jgi:hypothetical protein